MGGELRIAADPPVIVPVEDLIVPGTEWEDPAPLIKKLLASYRRTLGHQGHPLEEFRYVHAARKVVGVGSVGTRCYILLLTGRDNDDPLFLQVKEAQASVLEPYAGASTYPHHGQRVVMGQRLMQAAGDIFLGWQRIKGLDGVTRDYYVRQFHDWKGSADVDRIPLARRRPIRAVLRGDPGAGARPLGRPDRHRLLPRPGRPVRPGHRQLLRRLRRPERTRLPGLHRGRELRTADRPNRCVGPPGQRSASARSGGVRPGAGRGGSHEPSLSVPVVRVMTE